MASIAMDISDDYFDVEEEEDSHEYIRLEGFLAFVLSIDYIGYILADQIEAQDAAAGIVGASDGSELNGSVAEALETVEAPPDGDRDCPICMQDDDGTATWKETQCGHRFHGRCLERWLQAKGSCPMCRTQVVTMPTAAATNIAPEFERPVILELLHQVIANHASMEEEE